MRRLVIATALLTAAACSQGRSPLGASPITETAGGTGTSGGEAPAEGGEPAAGQLELRFDQTLTHDGLTIEWREVGDSRCPRGVTCIWAGEVTVTIALSEDGTALGERRLTFGPRDRAQAVTTTERHEVTLVGVEPYPTDGSETKRADYIASLTITAR